jgi:hypothetical protein
MILIFLQVGEGGIILLPGASVGESFTDDDDEILRSLEGPPSPCDVTFINDNILIDGKSSLSQKTKKAKVNPSNLDWTMKVSRSLKLLQKSRTTRAIVPFVYLSPLLFIVEERKQLKVRFLR